MCSGCALRHAGDAVLTDTFSGRRARLLRNRLIDLLEDNHAHRIAFPEQLSMTRNLRKAAAATDNAEFLPMFAGQGRGPHRTLPAAELVRSLVAEVREFLP